MGAGASISRAGRARAAARSPAGGPGAAGRGGRPLDGRAHGGAHGLDDLLFEWGILAADAIAVETSRNSQIEGGDLLIRRFAPHPITNELLRLNMTLVTDRARVVREDPGRPIDESLLVKEIMATSDESWAEKDYGSESPEYDSTVDLKGPVRVAAVSERKVDSSLGISIPGGRLIVFGTSNFLTLSLIHI